MDEAYAISHLPKHPRGSRVSWHCFDCLRMVTISYPRMATPGTEFDRVEVCTNCRSFVHLNPEDSGDCELCGGRDFEELKYAQPEENGKPSGHPTLYRTAPLCPKCEEPTKGNPAAATHSRCYPTTMLEEPIPAEF